MVSNKPAVLTFVGKSFAHIGFRFHYDGKNPACPTNCNLLNTCQNNLVPGEVYEVVQVMEKEHPCPYELHDEEMKLVKVIIPGLVVSMENKEIFEGSVVAYKPIVCDLDSCPHYSYCVPELILKAGDKIQVKNRVEKIKECKKGKNLTKVSAEKKK